ncbi:MAG: hypothetical protein Q4F21_01000 [Lachnospiraceae bacterium]|nr:hypothetical protein [Lachnospiraceae bacterium]
MGRIMRCQENGSVRTPFYVAAAGIHLYSLEELSYFLQKFLYLVDEDFYNSELLEFLREELRRSDLAELVLSQFGRKSPVILAGELAFAAGDMSEKEKEQLKKKMDAYQRLTASGRKILRADMLLKQGEYEQAAEIYVRLLEEKKQNDLNDEMRGRAYYNMGKIYMAAFEWQSAGKALENAYRLLHQESVLQELYELSCISPVKVCDEEIFLKVHALTLKNWQEMFNRKKERIEKETADKDYEKPEQQNGGLESEADRICKKWRQDFRKIHKSCCQGEIFSV